MKNIILLLFVSFCCLSLGLAQEPEEPSAGNNELMVQTMNATGYTTQYELVPVGPIHCSFAFTCNYGLYSNPPTQSLYLSGNVICETIGFNVRTCDLDDTRAVTACATNPNGMGALRYGFYKINIYVDSTLRRHFYYDTRDCGLVNSPCGNCGGNDITVRYDVTNDVVWWFNNFNAHSQPPQLPLWQTLSEGQILFYGQIKNCTPRCFQPFWDNGLIVFPRKNPSAEIFEPHLVWGPYNGFQPAPDGYIIEWKWRSDVFNTLEIVGPNTYEYTHSGLAIGARYNTEYRVRAYKGQSYSNYTNVVSIGTSDFYFKQPTNWNFADNLDYISLNNFPNPFNPNTVISYDLPVSSFVDLRVYDVLGREVATLVDEFKTAGKHNASFDTRKSSYTTLTSGVYLYRICAADHSSRKISIETKKMILMR